LLRDPPSRTVYRRWNELRDGIFDTTTTNARIDGIVAEVGTAWARQFLAGRLGYTLFQGYRYLMFPAPRFLPGEIQYLKDWLQERAGGLTRILTSCS
jgi:hypothetical protein